MTPKVSLREIDEVLMIRVRKIGSPRDQKMNQITFFFKLKKTQL